MGNAGGSFHQQGSVSSKGSGNRVWIFLHRTWTVMVAERWTRTRLSHGRSRYSEKSEFVSQYSFCSCPQCQRDEADALSCGDHSDLCDIESIMSPNTEDASRTSRFPHLDDTLTKDKQRPPIYNPEDYAILLKKWGKKSANGMVSLYSTSSVSDFDCVRPQGTVFRDFSNPMLTTVGSEMTLRQFGTVSELLAKLKSDLKLAYPSFVQEFVADPLDGITLLLDLLRAIQLSQSNPGHNSGTTGKIPPSIQRRTLLDELSCLQCLLSCCARYSDAVRKLTASSAGLFTLAICIMSNVNKSRMIALQLLTKACEPPTNGHSAVSEAMSTLRLRFGEPVRFRFLVGMLSSAGGQKELLAIGLRFVNTFLNTAGGRQKRLYLQAELEQAGFDILAIRKNVGPLVIGEPIVDQFDIWEKNHIDIEEVMDRLDSAEIEKDKLRDKILLLERKVQILQEEKGVLQSLEQCLKERCSELQGEVHSLKSFRSQECLQEKKGGSTPEDEGISSSERSLTPEDVDRPPTVYDLYSIRYKAPAAQTATQLRVEDVDEETTVDEVMEELTNIINDAETELRDKEKLLRAEEEKRTQVAQGVGKIQLRIDMDDYAITDESEIVPSVLHPQPPRRAKSLVHLFLPAEGYEYCNKELFFENETAFTSDEGSDSLLSGSKFYRPLPRPDDEAARQKVAATPKPQTTSPKKYLFSTPPHRLDEGLGRSKCKSLDRINEGVDALVDIIVADQSRQYPKSDSGNASAVSLSNVLKKDAASKLSLSSEDKQRMFLPTLTDRNEVPYYFPRVQEKRSSTSSSFLIRRGHGNAGLYSGQVVIDNHHLFFNKSREFLHNTTCTVSGKVTDLASGLY